MRFIKRLLLEKGKPVLTMIWILKENTYWPLYSVVYSLFLLYSNKKDNVIKNWYHVGPEVETSEHTRVIVSLDQC